MSRVDRIEWQDVYLGNFFLSPIMRMSWKFQCHMVFCCLIFPFISTIWLQLKHYFYLHSECFIIESDHKSVVTLNYKAFWVQVEAMLKLKSDGWKKRKDKTTKYHMTLKFSCHNLCGYCLIYKLADSFWTEWYSIKQYQFPKLYISIASNRDSSSTPVQTLFPLKILSSCTFMMQNKALTTDTTLS